MFTDSAREWYAHIFITLMHISISSLIMCFASRYASCIPIGNSFAFGSQPNKVNLCVTASIFLYAGQRPHPWPPLADLRPVRKMMRKTDQFIVHTRHSIARILLNNCMLVNPKIRSFDGQPTPRFLGILNSWHFVNRREQVELFSETFFDGK